MKLAGKRAIQKNCLYPHNSKESMRHWLVKSIIFKALRDMGHTVRSEAETRGGIVDVLDEDNMIAYEVETRLDCDRIRMRLRQLWHLNDVFFIDCRKVPETVKGAVEYIKSMVV